MDKFIKNLKRNESESIIKVTAFMSYNPSIGRVLQKKGVVLFREMASLKVRKLENINSIRNFDSFHKKWIDEFMNKIKTNKGYKCSYGQAQKPINVFLKVYVDWARKPSNSIRHLILPFLHVPIDSILMKTIRETDPEWYNKEITPYIKNKATPYSLSKIDKWMYYRWQKYFRLKNPKKPLIFDIVWAVNR